MVIVSLHGSHKIWAKDKEETAQWFSSPATIKSMLEGCMGKVSSIKGQACIVHHKNMYEGNLEKAGLNKLKCSNLMFKTTI